MFGRCNCCFELSVSRVEVRTATERSLACGGCAVILAESYAAQGISYRILAAVLPRISQWICSDAAYYAKDCDARAHQQAVDRKAVQYAARIRTMLVQRRAKRGYVRLLNDLRESAEAATVAAN